VSASVIQLPSAVYDSALRGDISVLQLFILVLFYRRADFATHTVQGMSADLIIAELTPLGLIPDKLNIESKKHFVRKAAQELRLQGWFTWDYKHGSKRPYTIWLTSRTLSLLTEPVRDKTGLNALTKPGISAPIVPDIVREELSLSEAMTITSEKAACDSVRENVREAPSRTNGAKLYVKDQYGIGQGKDIEPADPTIAAQASELVLFIADITDGFTREHSWAQRILAKYPLLEFEYAFVEWYWRKPKWTSREMAYFCERGFESAIESRRVNAGDVTAPCFTVPVNWVDAQKRIALAKIARSADVAEFVRFCGELYNFTPPSKEVAEFIQKHSLDEVKAAWMRTAKDAYDRTETMEAL